MRQAIKRARWLILAMLGMLSIAALELWQPLAPRSALGLDNPAESRNEMIAEIRRTNERLDRIIALLEAGKVKVSLGNAEEVKVTAPKVTQENGAVKVEQDDSKIIIMQKNGHE